MEDFVVYSNDIEGRLDPYYYKHLKKDIQSSLYDFFELKDITDISKGQSITKDKVSEGQYPVIAGGQTSPYSHNEYNYSGNVITVSASGAYSGYVWYHSNPIFASDCSVIKSKDESKYKTYFIYTFLKLRQDYIYRFQRGAGQPHVYPDDLKKIQIPLPPLEVQNKIVEQMQDAYKQKNEKEQQAEELLNSIDAYVLKELGIELTELKNEMCFVVNSEEVKGKRIDPYYYKYLKQDIQDSLFELFDISAIADMSKGQSITQEKVIEGQYPVIAGGQTSPYNNNVYNYSGNVITVSASGAYSGYVWYHSNPIFASDCSVIKSKDETKYSTYFIYAFLKSRQEHIYRLQQGAGQPHVYSKDLGKLKIPVPPIDIQTQIASEVKSRMQQAGQLKQEAKKLIGKTKKDVEQMILT